MPVLLKKTTIVPDLSTDIPWERSRGELTMETVSFLTEPVVHEAKLVWETSGAIELVVSGDTLEEAIEACVTYAEEHLVGATPPPSFGLTPEEYENTGYGSTNTNSGQVRSKILLFGIGVFIIGVVAAIGVLA